MAWQGRREVAERGREQAIVLCRAALYGIVSYRVRV